MSFLSQSQKDDLRLALLSELVAARTVALSAEILARRLVRSRLLAFEFDLGDVQAELEALHQRGLVAPVSGVVESVPYFQATAAGVLAHRP